MRLPITTTGMQFMCAANPEPVLDFETKTPKTGEQGQPLFSVQVVALSADGAEVISVKTLGQPEIQLGELVALTDLIAIPWAMGDRSGIAFRAGKIEPAGRMKGSGGARG